MKRYELTTIIGEKSDEKAVEAISKSIRKFIEDNGGKIETADFIGRKKFAYLMKKNEFGTYLVFKFMSEKDQIKNIRAKIKAEPEILRFLLIGLPIAIEVKIKKPRKIEEKVAEKVEAIEKVEKAEKKPEKAVKIEKIEKDEEKGKPAEITKTEVVKPQVKEKAEITKEIESEGDRMKKLEEELDKILEE